MVSLGATTAIGSVTHAEKQSDGIVFKTDSGRLRLQVWSDRVIRVTFSPNENFPTNGSFSVISTPEKTKWKLRETTNEFVLATSMVSAHVNRQTAAVEFFDAAGKSLLQETEAGRGFSLATNSSGQTVIQSFVLPEDEHIYGLGQHQSGTWNYRGTSVRLRQQNMQVAIPVLVSSRGYGLLWDNPAVTDVDIGKADARVLSWTSEAGKSVDYYFMFGPTADDVIRDYRELTGAAPMMAEWFWGFWQCKERYQTQAEMIGIVEQQRALGVPLDGIIQDWQYWTNGGWGSHKFDPARYPDPAAMVKTLHDLHAHVLISVWPKFDLTSGNITEFEQAGALFPTVVPSVYPKGQQKWYDPFSAAGREIYWRQISKQLFSLGFDGWWLDASEAEFSGKWGEFGAFQTADGPGAEVYNAYPLMHTTGIYRGQRAQTDQKRVVILTRSSYAGQQRNAAVTWSGDIRGNWDVFARQIPAGLNFSLSGIPYWNTDIGGFFSSSATNRAYQELFTRWFQFGAFNPMFRVHGSGADKEVWRWDAATQKILADYIRLRYRLMPYIYSVSWQVTSDSGSMLRPLMMDFGDDAKALDVKDQFLFGPAIMASPVVHSNLTSRIVYLPGTDDWYDFWTGKRMSGGQSIDATAPIEKMPLHVRAGTILPLGPVVQYVSEKPADPIELRVYRGADGAFTLYEDEGDNYNYEHGAFATISLAWDDARQTLTIGARKGIFPGMLKERTFRVIFVGEGRGVGGGDSENADAEVKYTGKIVAVKAKR